MNRIYFVRHAQPDHDWEDDRTRPLTKEGQEDTKKIVSFFEEKQIDLVYCSPYRRSIDTIKEVAELHERQINLDERLRERKCDQDGNRIELFQKRWSDLDFHEQDGESIRMVQKRNIEALKEILAVQDNKTILIGTHGTALSSILNYYDPSFGCKDFLRTIDWMPYILELQFEEERLILKKEHLHVHKMFQKTIKEWKEK